jgi:hypothetical protein
MALVLRPPGSRESLTENLADLGRFRKRIAVAVGLFRFIAVVVGCAGIACVIDSIFHLPPIVRAFALVLTLTLGGVFWIRGVSRALALRTDSLSVALELEEKYPKLNDALASAVSFLEAGDGEPRGVSNRLQEAAVKQAKRAADRHDLERIAPVGACWRSGWAAGLVLAVVIPLALTSTERAETAVLRLVDPFSVHPWPTKTRVEILVPEELPLRMPRGEPFLLKFAVRGVIKDRAILTVRITGGEEFHEEYPLAPGNDPKFGSAAAVVSTRIEAGRLSSSFMFKIVANDFDSDWQRVDVVPPPRLVALGNRQSPQFNVAPPDYTGLPTLDLPDGATVLEVPVGSVVRMRAATDVPLSAAVLSFAGDRAAATLPACVAHLGYLNPLGAAGSVSLAEAMGSDIPLSLDGGGKVMSATFAPNVSGSYALKLTDETGLTGTRPIEIRLVPDPAPIVTLLRPTPGRDPAVLTPNASALIHVVADDRVYAVRRTFLEYHVGHDGTVRTIPLHDVRESAGMLPVVAGGAVAATRPPRPSAVNPGPLIFSLAAFTHDDGTPLRDGDTLFLRGAADDWDDVTPTKEPGRSGEIEIRIASPDAVEAWLQRELAALRPDLLRLRDHQRDARQKAGEVAAQADGTLIPADRDRLLAAEQTQRQIRGKISDAQDGIRAKADILRETVRANNLPRSNTTDRIDVVANELGRLADRDLPAIEPNLSDARQFGGQPPRAGQEKLVPDLLKKATRHQKAVEDGLSSVLDLLAVWGGAIEIRGEARVLRDFVLRQAGELEKLEKDTSAAELDRAGTRAEQAADQASQLIGRATRLASEKDKQADAARAGAKGKADEAAALRAKAAALPAGTPDKSSLNAKAALTDGDAEDLKAAADKASAEADALRKAIHAAGGQGLPEELRAAAAAARKDNRSEADKLLRSSATRLDRLIDELTEKQLDTAPDLEKRKKAADDLNTIADAQDDIRKRAAEAAKIADPMKRAAEMKKLAGEQDKVIERGKEVLQRLTRDRADAAARDTRAALDHMDIARNELENGNSGMRAQNAAVDKLDAARDKLDAANAAAPQQLSDETRRKMADKVKALFEKQKAAVAEAERIHKLVAKEQKWGTVALTEYGDIALFREEPLAKEVRVLEKDFASLPVLARLLNESASAMDAAGAKITGRVRDTDPTLAFDAALEASNDRKINRPMNLAARRLEQLLDALKQDDPKAKPKKDPPPKPPGPMNPMNPMPMGGAQQDIVPPLAQLKVLRSLQAELNRNTADFHKEHPDLTKVTDDDLRKELEDELKELEQAQRDIAALFEQMAKLFEQEKGEKPENPAKPEKPEPPAPEKP